MTWLQITLGIALFIQTWRTIWMSRKINSLTKTLGETRRTSSRLIHNLHLDLWQKRREYEALEKGADEQQESFEQEYLSWDDQRKRYDKEIEELETEVQFHRDNCLPQVPEGGQE